VVELFPYRTGRVWIARFLCCKTGLTFSLLPHWLVPYHHYTVASIVFALLLAQDKSLFAVAEVELDGESNANGWLLQRWLGHCIEGFRRSREVLKHRYDLKLVTPTKHRAAWLTEFSETCQAVGIRGPPENTGLDDIVVYYAKATKRFLFGIPSQDRIKRRAL
jgi:truncated hemoglobin YjbI